MSRVATGTSSEGAKVLENFIDGVSTYRELFDDVYFDSLDEVSQKIDNIESEMIKQLEDKDDKIEELENEIADLKQQLEELQ